MSEVKIIAQKSKAAVIGISETKLDPSIKDSEINIDSYTLIRKDRNRNGGVVCFCINDKFAFTQTDVDINIDCESIFVEINLPKTKPFVVGVVYRPPNE